MVGHWKFLGGEGRGGGGLKSQNLEAKCKAKLEFPGWGESGVQNKTKFPLGGVWIIFSETAQSGLILSRGAKQRMVLGSSLHAKNEGVGCQMIVLFPL